MQSCVDAFVSVFIGIKRLMTGLWSELVRSHFTKFDENRLVISREGEFERWHTGLSFACIACAFVSVFFGIKRLIGEQ